MSLLKIREAIAAFFNPCSHRDRGEERRKEKKEKKKRKKGIGLILGKIRPIRLRGPISDQIGPLS